jgi:hypothetical protein
MTSRPVDELQTKPPQGRHREHDSSAAKANTLREILAIQKYLSVNPTLSKQAVVDLLVKQFPMLCKNDAWILVARYFNLRNNSDVPGSNVANIRVAKR